MKIQKHNDYNSIKLNRKKKKHLRTENRTEKIKACKELLGTFGEIWHIQIKNSFILSGIVASPLKPTAKNIAAPPFLENLQQGSIDSFSEHQSEIMYINIYIYIC